MLLFSCLFIRSLLSGTQFHESKCCSLLAILEILLVQRAEVQAIIFWVLLNWSLLAGWWVLWRNVQRYLACVTVGGHLDSILKQWYRNMHMLSQLTWVCMCGLICDLWLCSTLTTLEKGFCADFCKGETVCTCVSGTLCLWKAKVEPQDAPKQKQCPLSLQTQHV